MDLKLLAVIMLTLAYVYHLTLSFFQYRAGKNSIPENVKDVYDEEAYRKWRDYHAALSHLDLFSSTLVFVIDLTLILTNCYAAFASLFPKGPYQQMFAVILLIVISGLLTLPFDYYRTFSIEEKFGFNRSTKATFAVDSVKNLLIDFVLNMILGVILTALHLAMGDLVGILFGGVLILLVFFVSFLAPVFTRIFNKFKPLEEGELKDKLTGLLEKHGYKVKSIDVMDASRRSSKLNAYFAGFGKMKTIVLYDTLVEKMSTEEICAVFAHEMGHGLHKDTLKLQILNFLMMAVLAVLVYVDVKFPGICQAFGFETLNYGFILYLVMSIEAAVVMPFIGLISNAVSRKAEYRADAQAAQEGYGEGLISGLKVLARENFADLAPSKVVVALEDNHPSLSDRIDAIEKKLKEKE